jgi:AcrR family transcriptional regulator
MKEAKIPERGTVKARQRAEMTEQILNAAEDLFSKHGLYGVTLKDVAKRVGVHHTLVSATSPTSAPCSTRCLPAGQW